MMVLYYYFQPLILFIAYKKREILGTPLTFLGGVRLVHLFSFVVVVLLSSGFRVVMSVTIIA